jgi:hypothetical protein
LRASPARGVTRDSAAWFWIGTERPARAESVWATASLQPTAGSRPAAAVPASGVRAAAAVPASAARLGPAAAAVLPAARCVPAAGWVRAGAPGYVQQPQGYGQQPYCAPQGQPGPNSYGQAHAAWSPPGGAPPQPPKKKSHAGIIVAVVAIVLVLIVAGGAAMWLSQAQSTTKTAVTTLTAPTSSTTKATTTATKATTAASQATGPAGTLDVTCSGTTIDSSAFRPRSPRAGRAPLRPAAWC